MTCQACGHPSADHWAPQEPPLTTTACRICLDLNLYVHEFVSVHVGLRPKGICCKSAEQIEYDAHH